MASELDFRPVSISSGDGAELVAAMTGEMRRLYCDVGDGLDLDSPNMPKAGPAELSRTTSTARQGALRSRGLRRGRQLQWQPGCDVLRGEAPVGWPHVHRHRRRIG